MRHKKHVWREAQQLLDEYKVRRAPVPVRRIAEEHACVIDAELDDDISGMLIPRPEGWVIAVNAAHSATRQRFTLAHELGHLRLHRFATPHADGRFVVRFRDERSSEGSAAEEIEANQFAAELLMPRALVLKELRKAGFDYAPDLEGQPDEFVEFTSRVARLFDVSQQALTIRLSSLIA